MTTADAKSGTLTNQDRVKLRAAVSLGPVRPFLLTLDRSSCSGTELNIHVAREAVRCAGNSSPRLVRRDIFSQIAALGSIASVRVKFHSRRALDKSRSLEQFIAKFERGERIWDPTGVFHEAERLVNFARELRRQLADELKGIYWSSRWRTTYVLLDEKTFAEGYCLAREKLAATERTVVDAFKASAGHTEADRTDQGSNDSSDWLEAAYNVRLCFDAPAMPLVPIDEASIPHEHAGRRTIPKLPSFREFRALSRVPLLTVLFGMGSASSALVKPPVIENTLMQTGRDTTITAPTVSAGDARSTIDDPLDGAALLSSGGSGSFPGGPGLHLFWRDPIHGAVGGSRTSQDTPAETQLSGSRTNRLSDRDEALGRDRFQEIAKSGGTFGGLEAIPSTGMLDLKWLSDSESTRRSGFDTRPRSSASPLMLSGVAAVLGLSNLIGSDSSYEASAIALEDLRSHFGLPRSLQVEVRWHFDETALSSIPSHQTGDSLLRTVLMTRYESYWDWLRHAPASHSSNDQGENIYHRHFHNPALAQFIPPYPPPPGSSV